MFTYYATDYAPVDPITPPCDIVPIFIGYRGENKARCLVFDLTECVSTFGDGGFVISFIRQGDELPYLVTDTDRLENNAIWIITDTDTAVVGYGMVQLQYIVNDVVCKSALYRTITFDSNSIPGDVPDPYEDLLAQIAAYAAQAEGAATTATAAAATATTAVENGIVTERSQRIAADEGLNTRINELMGLAGAPSMAATAAAMTDNNKVYVYTGSEAGYLNGHWYYYNGSEWADGGVYQATAVDTDKTLTVENMAADAAVVGEKIDECMAAFVIDSASGNIVSFSDGADNVPVKDLVVNISPVQSGTGDPSPTNIRAISGWTEANITRSAKNIWGGLKFAQDIKTAKPDSVLNIGAGTIEPSGFSPFVTLFDKFKPNTQYTLILYGNTTTSSHATNIGIEYTDGTRTNLFLDAGTNGKCVAVSNSAKSILRIRTVGMDTAPKLLYEQCGLFEGVLTFDDFVPYVGETYTVSFGTAGTVYGGTLDVLSGMLTVTHGIVDLGTLTWSLAGSGRLNAALAACKQIPQSEVANAWCSNYRIVSNNTISGIDKSIAVGINVTPTLIQVNDSTYNGGNPATFKAAVSGATLVYELAQPVSVQLSAQDIRTLLGNNNIWADCGSVDVEYRADTKLYLEKLTHPDSDMVADANITSGSYFMVNNNLYLATANIANGGAITPGTNCTATNLAAALNAINS